MSATRIVVQVFLLAGLLTAGGVATASAAIATPSVSGQRMMPTIPGIPDCKDAPVPEVADTGVAGALDPAPDPIPPAADPFGVHPSTSVYDQYGYAGLTWHTYDLGCGGAVRDPAAATDTMIGNVALSVAVWLTAATNGLHNHVADPASYMGPLDRVVVTVTERLRNAIWSPWGAVAVIGVAAMLLFQAARGQFSAVVAGAAWAALVLAIMAAVTQYPSRASSFFDDTITSTIGSLQEQAAGVDGATPSDGSSARAQGALTVDRVLYDAWLRGQLGSSDSPAAKRWGPDLFRASAVSRSEAARATSAEAMKQLTEGKAQQWREAAEEVADQDPAAYAVLQGKAGIRMGTGSIALFGAVFVDVFRLVADVFLLAGLVMLRLLVMFLPAAAVVGIFAPMSGLVRQMANIGGAAVINVVAFAAGSVVYTAAVSAVLGTATDAGMGIMALVLCLVITLAAFVLMAPLLSFTRILGRSGQSMKLHRLRRQVTSYLVTRKGVNDGTKRAIEDVGDEAPEPTSPVESSSPRRPGAPRTETFARPHVVWDVTGDGGLAQVRPAVTVQPAGSLEPQRAIGPRTGFEAPRSERTVDADPTLGRVGDPQQHVTAPAPASETTSGSQFGKPEVVTGEVVRRPGEPRLHVVKDAHDGNTQVSEDGAGYFVYDPRTGALKRHGVEPEAPKAEAS